MRRQITIPAGRSLDDNEIVTERQLNVHPKHLHLIFNTPAVLRAIQASFDAFGKLISIIETARDLLLIVFVAVSGQARAKSFEHTG